jgi:hypothetical protein
MTDSGLSGGFAGLYAGHGPRRHEPPEVLFQAPDQRKMVLVARAAGDASGALSATAGQLGDVQELLVRPRRDVHTEVPLALPDGAHHQAMVCGSGSRFIARGPGGSARLRFGSMEAPGGSLRATDAIGSSTATRPRVGGAPETTC